MTFAERLVELRKEHNMSLNDIAACIGVQRATVYKYEHGLITNIPPDKVHTLANLFGVTRPYLMGWTDERKGDPGETLDIVAEKQRTPLLEQFEYNNRSRYWKPIGRSVIDCTTAATQAARALIKFNISRTPIYPQQILQASKYATMISFGDKSEIERVVGTNALITQEHEDLVWTSALVAEDKTEHYLFTVNRYAPMGKLKLAIAVELGHIYLGHGFNMMGSEKATMEAECFAIHLIFPRPLIKLLQERGVVLTKEMFSRIFGDCEWCLDSIIQSKPVRISPELNRLVKEQFTPYVDRLDDIGIFMIDKQGEELDLSRYMKGYEE